DRARGLLFHLCAMRGTGLIGMTGKRLTAISALSLLAALTMTSRAQTPPPAKSATSFAITCSGSAAKNTGPLDGRLFLLLSTNPAEEPRLQIHDNPKTQIVFGMDLEGWKPGEARAFDASQPGIFGFPIRGLENLKPGEYF